MTERNKFSVVTEMITKKVASPARKQQQPAAAVGSRTFMFLFCARAWSGAGAFENFAKPTATRKVPQVSKKGNASVLSNDRSQERFATTWLRVSP